MDPYAIRLVRRAARHTWITPNRLTAAAFAVGLIAAAAFAQGSRWWLLVGALAYHASFVIDCMDGKLARVTGTGSTLGKWLDFTLDRVLVTICAVTLLGGQFTLTRDPKLLIAGAAVVFLNLYHQLNGQIMEGALRQARARLGEAAPAQGGPARAVGARPVGIARLRNRLGRRRIRADVFSAIEFQMSVFVVGPVLAAITGSPADLLVAVTAGACILLVAFDLAMIAKFVITVRRLDARWGDMANTRAAAPLSRQADHDVLHAAPEPADHAS